MTKEQTKENTFYEELKEHNSLHTLYEVFTKWPSCFRQAGKQTWS